MLSECGDGVGSGVLLLLVWSWLLLPKTCWLWGCSKFEGAVLACTATLLFWDWFACGNCWFCNGCLVCSSIEAGVILVWLFWSLPWSFISRCWVVAGATGWLGTGVGLTGLLAVRFLDSTGIWSVLFSILGDNVTLSGEFMASFCETPVTLGETAVTFGFPFSSGIFSVRWFSEVLALCVSTVIRWMLDSFCLFSGTCSTFCPGVIDKWELALEEIAFTDDVFVEFVSLSRDMSGLSSLSLCFSKALLFETSATSFGIFCERLIGVGVLSAGVVLSVELEELLMSVEFKECSAPALLSDLTSTVSLYLFALSVCSLFCTSLESLDVLLTALLFKISFNILKFWSFFSLLVVTLIFG